MIWPKKVMPDQAQTYQVVIIGGGLVGMASALSLANAGIKVAMLEARLPDITMFHTSYDSRTLVVNPASEEFWRQLGVWQSVLASATKINQVHVSSKGQFGRVLFDKDELQVPVLGHVVEANVLGAILWDKVKNHSNVRVIAPANMTNFTVNSQTVDINYDLQGEQQSLSAQLMIAADGAQSAIRQQLNLPISTKAYNKTAVICSITTEKPHNHRAYERLTPTGPFALLPFNGRMGLVWSNEPEKAEQLLQMSEAEFIELAQAEFGHRLGRFTEVGQRHQYPLFKIQVEKQYKARAVLLGNAAHTVSPVSAQGLNLAIRGVKRLSALLSKQHQQQQDLGAESLLETYQHNSLKDQNQIMAYTDDLMTWFKIDEPIINGIKSMGLVAIDSQISLKKKMFRLAAGLNHSTE
ncbi:MAG: FAD-dependent oxidoreductase [Marinicella sp.]